MDLVACINFGSACLKLDTSQLMCTGLAGVLHRDAGNIPLAIDAYERCLLIDPDSRNAGQVHLLIFDIPCSVLKFSC